MYNHPRVSVGLCVLRTESFLLPGFETISPSAAASPSRGLLTCGALEAGPASTTQLALGVLGLSVGALCSGILFVDVVSRKSWLVGLAGDVFYSLRYLAISLVPSLLPLPSPSSHLSFFSSFF